MKIMNLIKEIFQEKVTVKTDIDSPFKFYRLKKAYQIKEKTIIEAGRIIAQWHSPFNNSLKLWVMATPTLHTYRTYESYFKSIQNLHLLEEVTMDDVQKLRHHWHKEFSDILKYYQEKVK